MLARNAAQEGRHFPESHPIFTMNTMSPMNTRTNAHSRSVCTAALATAALLAMALPASSSYAEEAPIEGDPRFARPAEAASPHEAPPAASAVAPSPVTRTVEGVLPTVRLTPRDVSLPDDDHARLLLDGEWGFLFDVPEGFDGTAASVEGWTPLQVPLHFGWQGHPRMHTDPGVPVAYTHPFEVPETWRGRTVRLRFEGTEGLLRLWINGALAGENDIATLPSEFDVTPHLRFGEENELTATIEWSRITDWSGRELGGITRSVWLQSLPPLHLARFHVDTALNHDLSAATLNARLRIANDGADPAGDLSLRFALTGPDGKTVPVDLPGSRALAPPVGPESLLELSVPLPVAAPHLWTAETPHLYQLTCELLQDGETVMSARQRFGFREVRVEGNQLLVNRRPVKLRGVNYHITYPNVGETMPPDLIRKDLELFLDANFNALRSRPTPDIAYVDLCDELGIYTTVEAMLSLMMYRAGPFNDHGDDPLLAKPYRLHVATMIENYYSSPSVITWGLGNECPYYDYFKLGALGMRDADPTRPLFFGSDARLGVDIPHMDINDDHYPRARHYEYPFYGILRFDDLSRVVGHGWNYPDTRPNIFTEWLHMHMNNLKELAFDPGIDDDWGYYALVHLNHLYNTPEYAGGFHFKGAPYKRIGVDFPWRGVFEDYRRHNDTFWHTRKSHSPVRIDNIQGRWDEAAGVALYTVENRFDFTPLDQVSFEWRQGEREGIAAVRAEPKSRGQLALPADRESGAPIHLAVKAPNGQLVDEYLLTLTAPAPEKEAEPVRIGLDVEEQEEHLLVRVGPAAFRVDRSSGLLAAAEVDGTAVLIAPPSLLVLPAQLQGFNGQRERVLVNQAQDWRADEVLVEIDEDLVRIIAEGAYSRARGRFETRIRADGNVELAYRFLWTEDAPFNLFAAGTIWPVAPAFDTLFWERNTLWGIYPDDHIGRATGRAPAGGDPLFAALRETAYEGDPPWPWSQDMMHGVTRDFRSTKFNILRAGLENGAGRSLTVAGGGAQHVHAVPRGDDLGGEIFVTQVFGEVAPGFDLQVYDIYCGGTEPHLTKSIRSEHWRMVEEGARFEGTVRLRIEP